MGESMRRPASLRRRMVLWLLAFAAVVSILVFAIGIHVHEHAEHAAWRSLLGSELTAIEEHSARDPGYRWQDSDTLRLYRLDAADGVPEAKLWAKQWLAMAEALGALPPSLRFDAVSLRHEQVNPDYEHLWLRLSNAQYGERRWPVFEFRLSANNVRKAKWSHLPKLEFPLPEQGGPKQFENWFEESEDDQGPKFELRFDMKAPAMDIQCWNALSELDQKQAWELVRSLPAMLQELEQAGARIHRSWDDWQLLATGIEQTLMACLNVKS